MYELHTLLYRNKLDVKSFHAIMAINEVLQHRNNFYSPAVTKSWEVVIFEKVEFTLYTKYVPTLVF